MKDLIYLLIVQYSVYQAALNLSLVPTFGCFGQI
jgi:hypothetical protein